MPWYLAHLEEAQARAKANGVKGAWWPKMVGPEGRESPSTVNPFIMWQQPHPIYLAETLWIARGKDRADAGEIQRAGFPDRRPARELAVLRQEGGALHPRAAGDSRAGEFRSTDHVQPHLRARVLALRHRHRAALARAARSAEESQVGRRVVPAVEAAARRTALYLAAESQPDLWERARSAQCAKGAASECPNRDHPSFVAALGLLPGWGADRETMRRTLKAVVSDWDLRQTWGWDWPMLAMTATRLDEPEMAVNFLLDRREELPVRRVGHDAARACRRRRRAACGRRRRGGPGYRRAAETYFPSNGSLLLAVALMAAGGQQRARAQSRLSAERAVDRAQRGDTATAVGFRDVGAATTEILGQPFGAKPVFSMARRARRWRWKRRQASRRP